ncbi:MAG: rod shape-determining protein [Oscillospiraceae bacterium]|nr:rod shape-determining protein [Oscillospiraceae bacterium]
MNIGIDLGTANIMITSGAKGVVFYEPSVVAFNKRTEEIIAVGMDAYKMIGKTPEYIAVIRPLCDGVISDYDMADTMIKECIDRVTGKQIFMPNIIICVPSLATDVECRAVVDAARKTGARKVYLIEEPVAALLGTGADLSLPRGRMVVDIGGGTTDIAVMSMNGIVVKNSVKLGGNLFDRDMIKYVRNRFRIEIGERTAENAKIALAQVGSPDGSKKFTVRGKNLVTGMPGEAELTDFDMYKAVKDDLAKLIETVRGVLEQCPPELSGDIYDDGIVLTGGGALIAGLGELMTKELGVRVYPADDPIRCVARGTGNAFRYIDVLRNGFEKISNYNRI